MNMVFYDVIVVLVDSVCFVRIYCDVVVEL